MAICRYTHHEQDEVQSQYWTHQSTTLFPAPIFFKVNGQVWTYSFVLLSNDGSQDATWVQHAFSLLLQDKIPALLAKMGAASMIRATIITDNCPYQFKCMVMFGYVGHCGVYVDDDADKRLHLESHYYGDCHGKSISNSEGAVVKTFANTKVANGVWMIKNSFDLFAKLSRDLSFELRDATAAERNVFAVNSTGKRRSPQRTSADGERGKCRSMRL